MHGDITAKQRMERALKCHIRRPHEAMQLSPGDQVDFYRTPASKDESGWRGLASVIEVGPPATIKWQDRRIQVRTQDVRRALLYLMFLTNHWAGEKLEYQPIDPRDWYPAQ